MTKLNISKFPELTSSELDHIHGGDWWSDFFKQFPPRQKFMKNNKYKIVQG